ncbi:hypothetical protein CRI70_08415 [Streptomyces sp. Ru87]|nr:hypothetical protein CRI70_08415 [Streptomyces sp. Ru87]
MTPAPEMDRRGPAGAVKGRAVKGRAVKGRAVKGRAVKGRPPPSTRAVTGARRRRPDRRAGAPAVPVSR